MILPRVAEVSRVAWRRAFCSIVRSGDRNRTVAPSSAIWTLVPEGTSRQERPQYNPRVALPSTIDRYRILGELGRGAMGTVYRAHDPRLDREVAVKTISGVVEEGTQGDELTARFEREARVAARLRHPNVVTVHDAGRDGDRLFLVLELVEGESLAGRLARGDFPPWEEALELAAQAADALAAAHAAGIVHRDVKPGNLLLARDGRVLMTDFGIAKALGETSELTRTGMVVGSPAYLSPEQVQGLPLDGRSDLFSLGVVLFEILLRRKPFAAETFTSLVYQILHADPLAEGDDLRALPPELAELLRDALAKDREQRLPDARLFAARAREIARQLPERSAMAAPTMVLSSGTGSRAPTSPALPAAAASPSAAPTAVSKATAVAAPTAVTAVSAAGASGAERPARGPWLGFAFGALAVGVVVAAVLVARTVVARPAAPESGAPPAVALVDSARPLAQPERPAAAPVPEAATTELTSPAAPTVAPVAPSPPPLSVVRRVEQQPPVAVAAIVHEESRPAPAPAPAVEAPKPVAPAPEISATFETQRGAEFHVSPENALVTIEGVRIGIADDWDGMGGGREFVFQHPGSYLVRLDAAGFRTAWIRIVVRPEADDKVIDVDTELEELE